MNNASFIQAFDLFASCYVYGCLGYVSILFLVHLYYSLFADQNKPTKTVEPDFYEQVKELLNPATEEILETTDFTSMTLRELRTHIKEHQLHQQIRQSVGKTVSNACKQELIEALS